MHSILVIDDDAPIRKLIRRILAPLDIDVFEAANGREGLEICREKTPGIIITDIVMPEKEGIETIFELKKLNPDLEIIAISGGGKLEPFGYLDLAEKMGAKYTLSKPIETQKLLEIVTKIIESFQMR